MTSRSSLLGVLLSLGLGVAACQSAAAQDTAQCAELPSDRTELFAFLVRNPGNVCATLRYAQLSTKAGDLEAAIGALERVLFYEPNEPNTRLYLGLLYSRLGSNDMARGYFESVLEHPATPQAIKDRATYLMGQATDRTEASQWRGFVRTGLRWQSNANYAADGEYIAYDPDNESYFETEGVSESDWNVYAQGGVFYSYDFGNQRGDAFEASLTTYNTRQFDLEEFNYNQAEATLGVRFGIPTGNPIALASIKPYLTSSGALLDDEELYWEGGGGVQGTLPVGNWTFGAYAQAVWREYDENTQENLPTTDEFSGETGWVYSAGLRIASDPRAASRFNFHIGYERREIDDPDEFFVEDFPDTFGPFSEDYLSYDRLIAEMRLPFDLYIKGHHLLLTPLVGVRYTRYGEEVDPYAPVDLDFLSGPEFEKRKDLQVRVGAGFDYAITDMAGVGAQLLYTVTDSNLPAYDTDNLSISFGPHFRF